MQARLDTAPTAASCPPGPEVCRGRWKQQAALIAAGWMRLPLATAQVIPHNSQPARANLAQLCMPQRPTDVTPIPFAARCKRLQVAKQLQIANNCKLHTAHLHHVDQQRHGALLNHHAALRGQEQENKLAMAAMHKRLARQPSKCKKKLLRGRLSCVSNLTRSSSGALANRPTALHCTAALAHLKIVPDQPTPREAPPRPTSTPLLHCPPG